MPKYNELKALPFTQKQLFNIVGDVEKYPSFVPWCKEVIIKDKKNNHIMADLTAGNHFLSETYTSDIYLTPYSKIEVTQNKGPFKYLFNTWTFDSIPGGTEIAFKIDFEFSSFIFEKTLESVFMEASTQMIQAFEAQAHLLYAESCLKKSSDVSL